MPPEELEDRNYPANRRISAGKLETNPENGSKSAGTEDAHLGDPSEPVTPTGDREDTSPSKQPTTTESRIGTTLNPENVAARGQSLLRNDQRPLKLTLKNGEIDFDRDDSSSLTALHQALGTADLDLTTKLLARAIDVVPDEEFKDLRQYNHVLAALHGIGPRDTLEGMLAVQMVATHNLAMEFLKRAAQKERSDLGVDLSLNRATKLQRTFIAQMEALNRHRGKGQQKMNVEHVHVHDGAQAIVGPVSHQKSEGASE